jgi:hypothetical protein
MQRRDVLKTIAAGSIALLVPPRVLAALLTHGNQVSLRCLGDKPGPRFLDGRTRDGTVGLAPKTREPFSGTKWQGVRAGEGIVAVKCLGDVNGPRWLDGRTATGTVGLAPTTQRPFTGTRWKVVPMDDHNPDIVALQCLGTTQGPRWLDGRTLNGTVGLAPTTDAPFTGTRWEVKLFPVSIDQGTNLNPVDE